MLLGCRIYEYLFAYKCSLVQDARRFACDKKVLTESTNQILFSREGTLAHFVREM